MDVLVQNQLEFNWHCWVFEHLFTLVSMRITCFIENPSKWPPLLLDNHFSFL